MKKPDLKLPVLGQVGLFSFLVITAVAVSLAYLVQEQLTKVVLDQEAKNAVDQVEFVIAPNLTAADYSGILPERLVTLRSLVNSRILGINTVHVKIWNKDGVLVYSDESDLVGKQFPLSDELQQGLAGKTAVNVSASTSVEAFQGGKPQHLFKIYVPIRPRDSNNILGVYESDRDLDALQTQTDNVQRLINVGLGVGFLVLYIMFFLIVRGVSLDLMRRNRDNQELYALEQRRSRQMQIINEAGRQLYAVLDLDLLLREILRLITERFRYDRASIHLVRGDQIVPSEMRGFTPELWERAQEVLRSHINGEELISQVVSSGRSALVSDVSADSRWTVLGSEDSTRSVAVIPMIARGKVAGAIVVASDTLNAFEPSDMTVLELVAAQSAIAVENAELYQAELRNVRKLNALQTIDHAISATLELKQTLGILIERAIDHLGQRNAGGFVALVEPGSSQLKLAATHNLSETFAERFVLEVGESIAEQVVEDGVPHVVAHVAADSRIKYKDLIALEKFQSLMAVPLAVDGKSIGALAIYTRQTHEFSNEETDFFVTLGTQAVIAVQNAQLYEKTRDQAVSLAKLAQQLEESYINTLAAMSAALDLRDRETEGHSQRVSDLTVKLATSLGMTDEQELRDIRYGSLLHDVGKIGISDSILLKAGALSTGERVEMKKHPEFGADILRGVKFLEGALPVVLYHQERWDGSGYPKGLKGEEIPWAARIFAVIDVYDALASDRPYRQSMSRSYALDYVRSNRGILFDSQVVDKFVEIIAG
jgi:HD-GYP domain-containing protein (c-di-GMP phosphodiesterase class II)